MKDVAALCFLALFGFVGVVCTTADYFGVLDLPDGGPFVVESIDLPARPEPPKVIVEYSDPEPTKLSSGEIIEFFKAWEKCKSVHCID